MIFLLLILALILRVTALNQSLWLDEAINVVAATQYSFFEMVTKYPIGDFHPPGYFALLWIWVKLGGIGEIWVRLPSVIFGVLTVGLVYLLGKTFFGIRIALFGAFFMALAPLHVYYSQEARMYSLAAFSATLSFFFFWGLISKVNKWHILGYTVSSVLVLYSDYMVYLIFPAQLAYLLLFQREKFKNFLWPVTLSFLTLIPWLYIFPRQLFTGTSAASDLPGWANIVGGAGIKDLLLVPIKTFFGRISIENKLLYGVVVGIVGLIYGYILIEGVRKLDKETKLLICWIIIPLALSLFISFFIPVLSYFRMLYILPAIYLLLAKGVVALVLRALPGRLALSAIVVVSLISLGVYYTNPKFQREDWRGAVKDVESRLEMNDLVLLESNDIISPYLYYSKKIVKAAGGLEKVPAKSLSDIKGVDKNVENIYLFEYLVDITDLGRFLEKNIENFGYKKVETLNFNGVGFVHHYTLQY